MDKLSMWQIVARLLFVLFHLTRCAAGEQDQEPKFSTDFPLIYDFSNSTGGKLSCIAHGQPHPSITWLLVDGSSVTHVPRLRQTMSDGSLVFPPFAAEDYRQDVHGVNYKCAATNALGTVVSNEIKVRGVVNQAFDIHVYDVYAIRGNTAVMRCHIPKFLLRYVTVTAWIKDSVVSITSDNLDINSKYMILPTGELLIREVDASDAHTTYRCQVKHRLTGEAKTSLNPGRLIVTDSQGKVPPKMTYSQTEVTVPVGDNLLLPCVANGNPAPKYLWTKQTATGSFERMQLNGRVKSMSGSLIIQKARGTDSGMYVCTADNEVNSDKIFVQVTVIEPLKVLVAPAITAVDANQAVTITCRVTGLPVHTIYWLKDGKALPDEVMHQNNETVYVPNMSLKLTGIYQCLAENDFYASQGVSVVKMGDTSPIIIKGFDELTLESGNSVEIRCSAKGNPTPQIQWKLDNFDVPLHGRGNIFVKLSSVNEITSTFIISKIKVEDGGVYFCIAKNKKGETYHAARINIQGNIGIRTKVEYKANEGNNLQMECPVYGYPIKNIRWEKDGITIPFDKRHGAYSNGSLLIESVQSQIDNGQYTCTAAGTDRQVVKGNIELIVMVPPKVTPFSFHDELIREGARARIQCVIREGQSPIKIIWLKNGDVLEPEQGIVIHDIDEFSSILMISSISPRHNGNYTCKATNAAGSDQHTATLFVNVAPRITPFSFPQNVFEGRSLIRVSCVVYQGDLPLNLNWLKNGLPIITNEKYSTIQIDDYSSILKIEKIIIQDSGNYTCTASNSAATVSHTSRLTVYVPPKVVPFTFQDDFLSEGMLVRVSCVVSRGDVPLSISWLKDNQIVSSELSVSIRKFDEYSSVLSIDPVTSKHAGNYTCVAQNHAGLSSHTAKLTVRVPPRWVIKQGDLTTATGKTLLLHCQADGFPLPTITWEKASDSDVLAAKKSEKIYNSDNIHIFENGTLSFEQVQRSDEGLYICEANNGIQPISHVITVRVQAAPEFKEPNIEMKVKKGEDIEILCEANGNWPISYHWTINNQSINEDNTRYKIADIQDETAKRSGSKLMISWVDRKDSVVFYCVAKNDIGTSALKINLIVQESPDPPEITQPVTVINQTVELIWTLEYNGNCPVLTHHVQYKKEVDRWDDKSKSLTIPGKTMMAKITNLKPATTYSFRVFAENELGNGSFSNVVTARTEEFAPEGPPENVDVESLDANTLRVIWKPPKKHLWNGAIRGYNIGYKVHGSSDEYIFKSLEVPEDYTEELIYQLTDLHMYTQYDLVVQAYNSKGPGPKSDILLAMTSEDVPSNPPQDVRCSSLSSKSIYILWDTPDKETINGILRGYKVLYKPVDEWYDAMLQSKIVESPKVTIMDLDVNTNYSIQVLAFTKMGDGIKSTPIFCKTHEDVPEPPESVKVLPSSSDSVVISWKPPHKSNGALVKYNIYYKPIENGDQVNIDTQRTEELQRDAMLYQSTANNQFVELKGLKKDKKYAFWVTATSAIGESGSSSVVAQTVADSIVAAKTASFDSIIKTAWKEDVILPCLAVGVPTPNRKWTIGDYPIKESNRLKIKSDGSIMINKISSEDSGNYTCAVYNEHGRDEVSYMVAVQVPPSAPLVDIVSKTRTSVKVQWKAGLTGGESIRGYLLHFKEENGIWNTVELRADQPLYTLDNLVCGATYQLYMEAFNNIGTGLPCDTITITTDGADIIPPSKDQIIREGSTFVTIHLETWPSSGCPVKTFAADYKAIRASEWTAAGLNIRPTQKKLVISGLNPATWYILRLKVESSNKPVVAEYKFATHTPTGGTLPPDTFEESLAPVYIFSLDPVIFIPAVGLLIVVIIASVVLCLYFKRRNGSVGTPEPPESAMHMNTWINSQMGSHTLPRGHFSHPSRHGTLARRTTDPSPYATSHITDWNHPEHGKNRSSNNFFPMTNEMLQQQAMFVPTDGAFDETKFVFPTPPTFQNGDDRTTSANQLEDGYDPPPRAHMMRN